MQGIVDGYYKYLDYLRENKQKVAMLQLTGRIEDYLVKEFSYYIHKNSETNLFPLVNLGIKGEQKIDIGFLKNNHGVTEITIMIEAKYFRNKHRIYDSPATDEIEVTLKDLARQLHLFNGLKHAIYKVNLNAKTKQIYGLVFASYASKTRSDLTKKKFYSELITKAGKYFKYHDLPKPYLRDVYNDVEIDVLGTTHFVSLKCGLWKRKV